MMSAADLQAHPASVVLLGASNVRIGLRVALSILRLTHPRLDAFVACGHGRSYGTWSSIPFRSLPGIVPCGLWDALDRHAAGRPADAPPIRAVVTDVGNDLLYGASVPQILDWVACCLDRLARVRATMVVTLPPFGRLVRLSRPRYYATRSVFFLPSRLSYDQMFESVVALRSGLSELAGRHGAAVLDPPTDWYGFDPIHIRWSRRTSAWTDIFSRWPGFSSELSAIPAMNGDARTLPSRLKSFRPERRRWFWRDQFTPQPAHRDEALTLWLY